MSSSGIKQAGSIDSWSGLLFLDVERGGNPVDALRDLPRSRFRNIQSIIIRLTERDLHLYQKEFALLSNHIESVIHWYGINHQVGAKPIVTDLRTNGLVESAPIDKLLLRARKAEVLACLEWGGGVWRPTNHHYLLPSGDHTDLFIHLGSALQATRDVHVLSYWLFPYLTDGISLILDSRHLTSLACAIESQLLRANMDIGRVSVLDDYPRTVDELRRAVREVLMDGAENILALLSVSSTGRLRDTLIQALKSSSPAVKMRRIVTLVDLTVQDHILEEEIWAGIADFRTPSRSHSSPAEKCSLCRDHERALVVPIDPRSFEAHFPTMIEKAMPDLFGPRRNSLFWQECSRNDAIKIDEFPEAHIAMFRKKGERLAIKVDLKNLVANSDFHRLVVNEFVRRAENREAREPWREIPEKANLLLIPTSDSKYPGWEELLAAFKPYLCTPDAAISTFSLEDSPDSCLQDMILAATSITVFTIGTITGHTVQHGLKCVQTIRKDPNFTLRAFILHARPESIREWQTLINSFARNLYCLWLSFLPSQSPIQEEIDLIKTLPEIEDDDALSAFIEHRLTNLVGSSCHDLFWDTPEGAHLSPHSLLGEELSPQVTYVALASALEAKRASSPPKRVVFAVKDFIRSYFDPLIICSFFRSVRPGECWWEDPGYGARRILTEILQREDNLGAKRMLCSELLLATALGKIPTKAALEVVVPIASQYSEESVSIRLGLKLLRSDLPSS